jgi:nucleotide-binding universal stress UspA family protein
MGSIVVATDGSEAASAALDVAIDIALETGDRLVVVTAWRALQGDFGLVLPAAAPLGALLDAERLHAEATLAEAASRGRAAGIATETRLTAGDPATVICALADALDARLIAIGTRGHSRLKGLLVGSISAAVVRSSGRPVLVVPSRRSQREPDAPRGGQGAASSRVSRQRAA